MKKNFEFPNKIPVFPLSNFIIFPNTNVPLNIFEPRYIQMVDDCMKGNRFIGIVQPKKTGDLKKPNLYQVGCLGKITSFNETEDGRYLIVLNGVCRYKIINELTTNKLYEYKFTMNNWSGQEQFDSNDACAYQAPGSPYWNRSLELGNLEKDVVLEKFCYNTCSKTCLTCAQDGASNHTVGSIKLTHATDKNWKDDGDIWEAFGNVVSTQVANPDLGEGNMSCMVNKLWDDNDQCEGWAGWAHRFGENCNDPGPVCEDNRLNFSTATKKKFKMKVHGPEGAVIIVKFEFNPYPNTSPTVERKIILSADQANKWSELVFDFSDYNDDKGVANALIYTYHLGCNSSIAIPGYFHSKEFPPLYF